MSLLLLSAFTGCLVSAQPEQGWNRFRGPNGAGVSSDQGLPERFGPKENLHWKVPLPAGYSSPVLSDDFVFVTGFEGDRLLTLCLRRSDGQEVWRREAPRPRREKLDPRNSPASPSPVTDGERVFVFFSDFGLLAYDLEGRELWRHPLGPFNNVYGMGASPILVDDRLILVCDQSTGSFIIAVGKSDGKTLWRTERPEAKSGHSSPVVYRPEAGAAQVIVPGSFFLTAYSADTGEKIWWVSGLSFELKSTPVIGEGVLFINGYGSPFNQPGEQIQVPAFAEALAQNDGDGDGLLAPDELPEEPIKSWFSYVDLAADGRLDAEDWDYFRAALGTLNGMLAIRLGGRGDMTDENVLWHYRRSVPQLPSPLLYQGVLYMVNDGGIVTSLDPVTGKAIRQGRLREALDKYYASPVAGDNKIYMSSETGKISVLRPDGSLEVTAVNDLGEKIYATPAIAGGKIFVRTVNSLFCFSGPQ